MRFFKRYRITEHVNGGFILDHRKLFGEWKQIFIFNSKTDAINGIKRHKEIKPEYR